MPVHWVSIFDSAHEISTRLDRRNNLAMVPLAEADIVLFAITFCHCIGLIIFALMKFYMFKLTQF